MAETASTPETENPAAEPALPPGEKLPKVRRRWFWWLMGLSALILSLLAGSAWLLGTEAGLAAVAGLVNRLSGGQVRLSAVQGRLWDTLRIGRLEFQTADLRLTAQGVSLEWQPAALWHRQWVVRRLNLAQVDVASRDTGERAKPPTDLRLPLTLDLAELRIQRLRLLDFAHPETLKLEVNDIGAELRSDGKAYGLRNFQAALPWGRLTAAAELQAAAPFALRAESKLVAAERFDALAQAKGTLTAFDLTAQISNRQAQATLELAMTPFAPVPFTRLRARSGRLDPADFLPQAPHAALQITADFAPQTVGQDLGLTGQFDIDNRAPGPWERQALPITALKGRLVWRPGLVEWQGAQIQLTQGASSAGRITGQAAWRGDAHGQLTADLRLQDLNLAAWSERVRSTRIGGRVQLKANQARQEFEALLSEPRFSVQATGLHDGQRISLTRLDLSAGPAGRVMGQGWFDLAPEAKADQRFVAQGRLENFDPLFLLQAPALAPSRIGGRFELAGRRSRQGALSGTLDFQLDASQLAGKPLAGSGHVALQPGRLEQVALQLDWTGNRLQAKGALGQPGDSLEFELNADHLVDALPGSGLAGKLLAKGQVLGSWAQPAGRVSLTAEQVRLPGGHGLRALNGQMDLAQGPAGVMSLDLDWRGLDLAGKPQSQQGRISIKGRRDEHELNLNMYLADGSNLSLSAGGGLTPGAGLPGWGGQIQALNLSGPVAWAFKLAAPVTLNWSGHDLNLGRADLLVGQGQIHLLDTHWSGGEWWSKGELSGLLLGTPPRRNRPNDTRLRIGGTWDVHLGRWLEGNAVFNRESGDLLVIGDAPARLGLDKAELRLHAEQGKLAGSLEVHGTRLGNLSGSGFAMLERDENGPLPLRLVPHTALAMAVTLDMPSIEWLGPTLDPNLQTGGSAKAFFSVFGNADAPQGQGGIEGQNLSLSLADQGLGLSGGQLKLEFDRENVRLSRLQFASPNRVQPADPRLRTEGEFKDKVGTLSLEGALRIADGVGHFNLNADKLPLLQKPDRWLVLSGAMSADTTLDSISLKGRLMADGGFWQLANKDRPRLSDDVVIRGKQTKAEHALRLEMDLETDLGTRFYLRGHGVDTRLEGALRLKNDGRGLRAGGSIKTVGGTFDAYGQGLNVEQGLVSFQGPLDNPSLNIIAMRKNQAVDAGVAITGTALKPRIKLVSEPEVPDAEKLSWLVLGHAPDQVGGSETGLLLSAATAMLGDGESGGLPRQLARGLGLDDVSVTTGDLSGQSLRTPSSSVAVSSAGGSATTAGQIVSLGKRLSAITYLSYEQSLSGAGNVVKLTHNLTRRLSLVGRAGTDNTLDLFYSVSFR